MFALTVSDVFARARGRNAMRTTIIAIAIAAVSTAASAQMYGSPPGGGQTYGGVIQQSQPYGANGPTYTAMPNGQIYETSRPYGPSGPSYTSPLTSPQVNTPLGPAANCAINGQC